MRLLGLITPTGWLILTLFAAGLMIRWAWRAKHRARARCLLCRGRKTVGTSKRWGERKCWLCKGKGYRLVWSSRFFQGPK